MSILGIIIVVLIILAILIALFFEVRSLIKTIKEYRTKKKIKEESKKNENKEV